MLDDVAVSLASGDVDAMTSGMAYCELICAAQGLALYERAGEWTQAMEHWRQGSPRRFGGFSGRCRVHRAEMLRLTGTVRPRRAGGAGGLRGAAAVDAARVRLAADRARQHPAPEGGPRRRRGGIPRRPRELLDAPTRPGVAAASPGRDRHRGGADRGCHRAPVRRAVQGATAVRRAAQGARCSTHRSRSRWLPATSTRPDVPPTSCARSPRRSPAGRSGRAPPSPRAGSPWPRATAGARSRECEHALVCWIELGAPFEAAVVRMVLVEARQRTGNDEGARMEWQAARRAFDEFGAALWAERAGQASTARPSAAGPRPAPTRRSRPRRRTASFDVTVTHAPSGSTAARC